MDNTDHSNAFFPLCRSRKSHAIIKFIDISKCDKLFALKNNGDLWGIYYENERIIAETKSGERYYVKLSYANNEAKAE